MAATRRTTEAPPRPWSRRGRISERPWRLELTTVPLQSRLNASPFCIILLLNSAAQRGGTCAASLPVLRRRRGHHTQARPNRGCVYREPKPGRNGGGGRPGAHMTLCLRSAEQDGSAGHLCPMIGAFSCRYNSAHRLARSVASAPRPLVPAPRSPSYREIGHASHSAVSMCPSCSDSIYRGLAYN